MNDQLYPYWCQQCALYFYLTPDQKKEVGNKPIPCEYCHSSQQTAPSAKKGTAKTHRNWYCALCSTTTTVSPAREKPMLCPVCPQGNTMLMQPLGEPSLQLNLQMLTYLKDIARGKDGVYTGPYDWQIPELLEKLQDD